MSYSHRLSSNQTSARAAQARDDIQQRYPGDKIPDCDLAVLPLERGAEAAGMPLRPSQIEGVRAAVSSSPVLKHLNSSSYGAAAQAFEADRTLLPLGAGVFAVMLAGGLVLAMFLI